MSINELRRCLGKFATGVTVVTCQGTKGPCGITANSFSSVSLEPPLLLWNIAKVSNSLQAFLDAQYFAISVLSATQQHLAEHFALADHTVFANVDYERNSKDVPLLPESVAYFECRTHQIHDCGDHYIIIGEIESCQAEDSDPLLFFGGEYAALPDNE